MKKKNLKEKNEKIRVLLLCVFVLAASASIILLQPRDPGKAGPEEILKIAADDASMRMFAQQHPDYTAELKELSGEELNAMAAQYPAIYGDLGKKNLYQLTYNSNGRSAVAIIDHREKRVLRSFLVSSVVFGGQK